MGTAKRFVAKNGLDNKNNSITNIGVSGSTLTMAGAFSLTLTTSGATNITFPALTATAITSGDTGTVTNTMLAGSIANAKLTNSSVTVGTTAISLGASSTTIAGLTSISSISTSNQATFGYDASHTFNINVGADGTPYIDLLSTPGYIAIRNSGLSYAGMRIGLWTEATGVSDNAMIAHNALTHTGTTYGNYGFRQNSSGATWVNAASTQSLILANNNTTKMTINSTGLGFYSATPVAQPTTAGTSSTVAGTATGNSSTNIITTTTFDGYTIAQVVKALRNLGLLT